LVKGTLLTLLAVALTGYFFNTTYIQQKYRIPKFQGHHLLYRSLLTGVSFFGLATVLFVVAWPLTQQASWLFTSAQKAFPNITQSDFNLVSILIIAFVLSLSAARLMNYLALRAYFSRYQQQGGDNITQHIRVSDAANNKQLRSYSNYFYELDTYTKHTENAYITHVIQAFKEPHVLLLTLENRRCYVCLPCEFKAPRTHQESQELAIIPLLSGYRHEKDLCLELTTDYKDVRNILSKDRQEINESQQQKEEDKRVLDSFKVTLPYDKIVSISSFDRARYRQFKEQENIRRLNIEKARNARPLRLPRGRNQLRRRLTS